MAICKCGCGGETTGRFCPGHDQKLRTKLENMVGGLLNLEALVEKVDDFKHGQIGCEDLCQAIKKILIKK